MGSEYRLRMKLKINIGVENINLESEINVVKIYLLKVNKL